LIWINPAWAERRHGFRRTRRRSAMLDAIMLAAGVAFFALSVAYVAACDRM
jgi:hypothetical protein